MYSGLHTRVVLQGLFAERVREQDLGDDSGVGEAKERFI